MNTTWEKESTKGFAGTPGFKCIRPRAEWGTFASTGATRQGDVLRSELYGPSVKENREQKKELKGLLTFCLF